MEPVMVDELAAQRAKREVRAYPDELLLELANTLDGATDPALQLCHTLVEAELRSRNPRRSA